MDATDEIIEKYSEAVSTIHSIVLHSDKMSEHEFNGWVQSQIPYWRHELHMRYGVE
jgi:hypothetical protein